MDILRVLATPDSEVRKKTLSLVLDLVSTRNIEDIVQVLKKVCTFLNSPTFPLRSSQF